MSGQSSTRSRRDACQQLTSLEDKGMHTVLGLLGQPLKEGFCRWAAGEMKTCCQVTERKAVLPLEGDDSRASRGQCDYKTAELRQAPSGLVSQSRENGSQQARSTKTKSCLNPTDYAQAPTAHPKRQYPNFPETWNGQSHHEG